ncbi:MAG TPA: lipocalin-like domain protein [Terracidiphilus sp.]|jgi:Lipocalin-like domain
MNGKHLPLLALLFVSVLPATAQSTSIVGTWALATADKLLPNGTRDADFGPNPHGLVIFTADGHYAVEIFTADRVTPDMSVHFGGYTVDPQKHTITFLIDRASHSEWNDTTAVRSYELNGNELSWKVAARPDGSIPITVLRRLSAGDQSEAACSTTVEERSKEGSTRAPDL